MTDGLLDLAPVWESVTAIFQLLDGPIVALLSAYLGLFVIGLIFEAVRSSKANKSDV